MASTFGQIAPVLAQSLILIFSSVRCWTGPLFSHGDQDHGASAQRGLHISLTPMWHQGELGDLEMSKKSRPPQSWNVMNLPTAQKFPMWIHVSDGLIPLQTSSAAEAPSLPWCCLQHPWWCNLNAVILGGVPHSPGHPNLSCTSNDSAYSRWVMAVQIREDAPWGTKTMLLSWLVGGWPTPLKNYGVRQLGWWHSQYDGKVIIQPCSSHHQPAHVSNLGIKMWAFHPMSQRPNTFPTS